MDARAKILVAVAMLLTVKSTNAQDPIFCDDGAADGVFRIETSAFCNNNFTNLTIRIWEFNYKEYVTAADYITGHYQSLHGKKSFFGARECDRNEGQIQYSLEDLKRADSENVCRNYDGGHVKFDHVTENEKSVVTRHHCPSSWMSAKTEYDLWCYYRVGYVMIQQGRAPFSNLSPMVGCDYKDGECAVAGGGYMRWEVNDDVYDDWIYSKEFTAHRTGNIIMIPYLSEAYSLTDVNVTQDGLVATATDQGNAIEFVSNETDFWDARGSLDIVGDITNKTLEAFEHEINGKLQYLAVLLAGVQGHISTLCKSYEDNQNMLELTGSISATTFARKLFKRKDLVAQQSGVFLMVQVCQIKECVAVPRNVCTRDLGVSCDDGYYFMDPQTGLLKFKTLEVQCRTYYCAMNGSLYAFSRGKVNRQQANETIVLHNSNRVVIIENHYYNNSTDLAGIDTKSGIEDQIAFDRGDSHGGRGDNSSEGGNNDHDNVKGWSWEWLFGGLGGVVFIVIIVLCCCFCFPKITHELGDVEKEVMSGGSGNGESDGMKMPMLPIM